MHRRPRTNSFPRRQSGQSGGLRHPARCRLTLVGSYDETGATRLGQWVLVHVGFAMSVINEEEARDTLDALQNMFDVEPDVGAMLYGEER